MRIYCSLALIGALLGLIGCSSPMKVSCLAPIGPAPTEARAGTGDGSLQVYSARLAANVGFMEAEWRWNNDFGKNEFLYSPGHCDYAIYAEDGALVKQVQNAQNYQDSQPTVVSLPSGHFEVAADAEDGYGGTQPVRVPVVIRSGLNTEVHLAEGWRPRGHYSKKEMVSSVSGDVAGWRANP
jgi:hypothetical protein